MPQQGLLQAVRAELERADGPALAREIASELRRRGFERVGRQEVEELLQSGAIRGLRRTDDGARWQLETLGGAEDTAVHEAEAKEGGDLTARGAYDQLRPLLGRRFNQLFTPEQIRTASTGGKGGWGNLFETLAGGAASSDHRDFLDGDLKTFACTSDGVPRNEVWLKNASADIGEYLDGIRWDRSGVGHKIAQAVLVAYEPCRGQPEQHHFALLQLADLREATRAGAALALDYAAIIAGLQATASETVPPFISLRGQYLVLKRKGGGKPRPTVLPDGRQLFYDELAWYLRPQFLKDHGHRFEPLGPLA